MFCFKLLENNWGIITKRLIKFLNQNEVWKRKNLMSVNWAIFRKKINFWRKYRVMKKWQKFIKKRNKLMPKSNWKIKFKIRLKQDFLKLSTHFISCLKIKEFAPWSILVSVTKFQNIDRLGFRGNSATIFCFSNLVGATTVSAPLCSQSSFGRW